MARKTQSFHAIERQDLIDRAAHLTSKEFADLIEGGQTDVVRSMLEHGANSNSKTGTPRSWPYSKPAGASIDPGTTLLNFFIVMNRLEIAELLSRCINLFESLPSDINHCDILFRPFAQPSDGNAQGSPQLGQAIGNVGRYMGLDSTFDQSVALQAAQCQREHTLRNPGDGPLEVVEPTRSQFEQNDEENAPFFAYTAQDFGHPIAVFGEAVFSILNHIRVPPVSTTCLLAAPPRMIILLRSLINTGGYMNDTWLITGSSVGLGRSIVEAALAAGHNVVATARDPASLDDLAARFPDRLHAQRLDVTDEVRAQEVVAAAVERFGLIDVLVNNAGFSGVGSIEDMPLDLIEAQFETNFMGAVHTCKAVLPAMRAQGRGRIILVSSIGARIATPGAGIYYASKAAVSALAETLALEVAPLGIKVTAVEPGAMRTRFAEAGSLQVTPFDPAYEGTVGATVGMMRSPEYATGLHDPAGVAAMILKVAALDEMPARILAGADSYEMGTSADAARRASDIRWEDLSRSATLA